MTDSEIQKDFTITQGKGFRLRFPNGWEISVQWGPYNYCSPHYHAMSMSPLDRNNITAPKDADFWDADSAECGIFNPEGALIDHPDHPGDTVQGYLTTTQVAHLIDWTMKQAHPEAN